MRKLQSGIKKKRTLFTIFNLFKPIFDLFTLDVGRAAPFASPIRFESLGLLHDPYTLPAGNPIDP